MSGGKGPKITFTVPGRPMPCPRPRVTRGKTYLPGKYKAWRDEVAMLAKEEMIGQWEGDRRGPLAGPVSLTVHFWGAHGSSDIDNLLKGVMDALEGIIYLNDRQVKFVEVHIHKHKPPYTQIAVTERKTR